jgi:hypothetical protein
LDVVVVVDWLLEAALAVVALGEAVEALVDGLRAAV